MKKQRDFRMMINNVKTIPCKLKPKINNCSYGALVKIHIRKCLIQFLVTLNLIKVTNPTNTKKTSRALLFSLSRCHFDKLQRTLNNLTGINLFWHTNESFT